MAGTLYLVATPIGNLEDLTYRAVRTLGEVDFVAAEDTRVSGKLLHYLEISKPLVSYHEHNKKQRGPELVERILAGENCALVTDAGMPAISDPGEDLANLCHEAGISVIPVPGYGAQSRETAAQSSWGRNVISPVSSFIASTMARLDSR